MVYLFPFRFEPLARRYLITNDAGDFFLTTSAVLERLVSRSLIPSDEAFVLERGFAFLATGDFYYNSFRSRLRERKTIEPELCYVIAIPTLRCNLACSYCQVARAPEGASGFDWSETTTEQFLAWLDALPGRRVKIEFQGGEPALRLDLVERVVRFCELRFSDPSFVLCTNLTMVDDARLKSLLDRPHFAVSTSLDGPAPIHARNRHRDEQAWIGLKAAIEGLKRRYGDGKIAALPTVMPRDYDRIKEIIDAYVGLGLRSIFLRPVSFHGFARRTLSDVGFDFEGWDAAYCRGLGHIFEINLEQCDPVLEYGLELSLRRIFAPSHNGHVDLRTPNPAALDYIVVDYDGRLYPSDEARMLARIRHTDLAIGSLEHGIDYGKARTLTWNQFNEVHEDCIHCAFGPFCGSDVIDELARYGRIDLPKHTTWFCRSQTARFTMIFEMLARGEPRDLANLGAHLTGSVSHTPFVGPFVYDPPHAEA
jgi:His-Xaa-Ser system radical SAM maturase HxsB